MGQKVNPIGFRLKAGNRDWDSVWYAEKDYADKLHQDLLIKKIVKQELSTAGVSRVVVRRSASKKMALSISSSRPGMIIGKKGADIERLKGKVEKISGCEVAINVQEIRRPESDAKLVAENICHQLERRVAFRKAAKRAIQSAMKMGAKGVKVSIAGRLNGAEIARTEWYKEGRVPLHTLRAEIDYALYEAKTTYGIIGVKVWIYKGEVDNVGPEESGLRFV